MKLGPPRSLGRRGQAEVIGGLLVVTLIFLLILPYIISIYAETTGRQAQLAEAYRAQTERLSERLYMAGLPEGDPNYPGVLVENVGTIEVGIRYLYFVDTSTSPPSTIVVDIRNARVDDPNDQDGDGDYVEASPVLRDILLNDGRLTPDILARGLDVTLRPGDMLLVLVHQDYFTNPQNVYVYAESARGVVHPVGAGGGAGGGGGGGGGGGVPLVPPPSPPPGGGGGGSGGNQPQPPGSPNVPIPPPGSTEPPEAPPPPAWLSDGSGSDAPPGAKFTVVYVKHREPVVNLKAYRYWSQQIPFGYKSGQFPVLAPAYNVPVRIELDSAWEGWNFVSPDGSDIYVADTWGNPIPYWIEEFDYNAKKAVIWVKVPFIPPCSLDGNYCPAMTLLIIYGYDTNANPNPGASLNDPHQVFEYFEGFDNNTLPANVKVTPSPQSSWWLDNGILWVKDYVDKYWFRVDVELPRKYPFGPPRTGSYAVIASFLPDPQDNDKMEVSVTLRDSQGDPQAVTGYRTTIAPEDYPSTSFGLSVWTLGTPGYCGNTPKPAFKYSGIAVTDRYTFYYAHYPSGASLFTHYEADTSKLFQWKFTEVDCVGSIYWLNPIRNVAGFDSVTIQFKAGAASGGYAQAGIDWIAVAPAVAPAPEVIVDTRARDAETPESYPWYNYALSFTVTYTPSDNDDNGDGTAFSIALLLELTSPDSTVDYEWSQWLSLFWEYGSGGEGLVFIDYTLQYWLPYYIVEWNPSEKHALIYVEIPMISPGQSHTIVVFFRPKEGIDPMGWLHNPELTYTVNVNGTQRQFKFFEAFEYTSSRPRYHKVVYDWSKKEFVSKPQCYFEFFSAGYDLWWSPRWWVPLPNDLGISTSGGACNSSRYIPMLGLYMEKQANSWVHVITLYSDRRHSSNPPQTAILALPADGGLDNATGFIFKNGYYVRISKAGDTPVPAPTAAIIEFKGKRADVLFFLYDRDTLKYQNDAPRKKATKGDQEDLYEATKVFIAITWTRGANNEVTLFLLAALQIGEFNVQPLIGG